MWLYEQKTGHLYRDDGRLVGCGYAGIGEGRNNPAMQDVPKVGPLPVGLYTIAPSYTHPKLGKLTMNLIPDTRNEMFGRDMFRIHGDNPENDASHGCIVQGHPVREEVSDSRDRRLQVVAEKDS